MMPPSQCLFVWGVQGPEWCEHFSKCFSPHWMAKTRLICKPALTNWLSVGIGPFLYHCISNYLYFNTLEAIFGSCMILKLMMLYGNVMWCDNSSSCLTSQFNISMTINLIYSNFISCSCFVCSRLFWAAWQKIGQDYNTIFGVGRSRN